MKSNPTLNESWEPFLVSVVIKFIELNKAKFGEQKSSILIKFSKGQSLEKIAQEEKLSTTRIRQLIQTGRSSLEIILGSVNIEELESLKEICKRLETENNSLRRTLKIHSHEENTPLSILNLSVRALKGLAALNITSVEQLCTVDVFELMRVKNAGIKTITEIESALAKFGLRMDSE